MLAYYFDNLYFNVVIDSNLTTQLKILCKSPVNIYIIIFRLSKFEVKVVDLNFNVLLHKIFYFVSRAFMEKFI